MTTQPPGRSGGSGDGAKVLGERYEVGPMIGRGGMADVRAGHDTRLGRTVAIKRLRTDLASDPTFQARFRREAQSAASLNHPSIVAVYDTGEEVIPDGTHVPYIVMELVEGRTLREILREGRKILPERALEITADVLSALDYSHRAGIVHRDIKPANVMLTAAGRVKVMDFGIARAIADASSSMTATAAVVGTAQYLSPEQARGEQVDARSDIYSTGCLLFELLTGRPPFQGDSPVSVAYQHVREEPPTPSSIEPEVSREIDAIVARSLAKKTSDRYQSAAQMRADIERVLAGQAVDTVTTAMPVAAPLPPSQETSFLPEQDDEEPARSRAWIWLLLVLVLLAGLAAGAYALINGGGDSEEVSVPGVVGMKERAAVRDIEDAGLVAEPERVSSTEPEGDVIDQDPDQGELLADGGSVTLTVSAGPRRVTVPPDLVGSTLDEASSTLEAADLVLGDVQKVNSTEPEGIVTGADPSSGNQVPVRSEVDLEVSKGPVEVPDRVDLTQEEAVAALADLGLKARPTTAETDAADPGTVISQDTPEGTEVAIGTSVGFTVAVAPETTTPPTTTPPTTTPPTTTPPPTETTPTDAPTLTPDEPDDPGQAGDTPQVPPTPDRAPAQSRSA
jgi:eukaryotic-like serine/threonine-protein kinase